MLGLTDLAGSVLSECRRGKNTRHLLAGLLRQSVFGHLAGYEDVNDAEWFAHDPAMDACDGGSRRTGSPSRPDQPNGPFRDRVHACRPQTTIVLDIDSSVSETHGGQEGSAYNGHFDCTC